MNDETACSLYYAELPVATGVACAPRLNHVLTK